MGPDASAVPPTVSVKVMAGMLPRPGPWPPRDGCCQEGLSLATLAWLVRRFAFEPTVFIVGIPCKDCYDSTFLRSEAVEVRFLVVIPCIFGVALVKDCFRFIEA